MKRLDKFVEVLFLRGADSLVLKTGSAAYLELPKGTTQAVMQRTLSATQIISAILELMPPYQAEGFSGQHIEEFEYVAPAGRVQVRFTPDGDDTRAELRRISNGTTAQSI